MAYNPFSGGYNSVSSGGQSGGQGAGGGGGEQHAACTWEVHEGGAFRHQEDIAGTFAQAKNAAVTAAKNYASAQGWTNYTIIVRGGVGEIYSEDVGAGGAGTSGSGTTEGEGGGSSEGGTSSGGQGGGGGGTTSGGSGGGGGGESTTGGAGEEPTLFFRFRLVGYQWTWTDKSSADPRLWKGKGAYYDLQTSEYNYGSNDDALAAGKAVGDANTQVIQVYAESNTPGFAGKFYQYNDRMSAAINAGSAEKAAAYQEYIKEKGAGTTSGAPSGISEAAAPVASIVVTAVLAIVLAAVVWQSGVLSAGEGQ